MKPGHPVATRNARNGTSSAIRSHGVSQSYFTTILATRCPPCLRLINQKLFKFEGLGQVSRMFAGIPNGLGDVTMA